MQPRVLSTNVGHPRRDPGGADRTSGIDKQPVPSLEVFTPGPSYGDGSGVHGDTVGDSKHHGGAQKAVYAYAREELDHWGAELGRELADGAFGENLTTIGVDLEALVINQQVRLGSALLEVSVPRTPCRTFAGWVGEPGWIRRFSARGRTGAYLRVVEPGVIHTGDVFELCGRPDHDVTMGEAFAAAMGDVDAMQRLVDAACLPPMYHQRHVDRLAKR